MLLSRVLAAALLLLLACAGSGGGADGEGDATDFGLEAGGGTNSTQPGINAKAQRLQESLSKMTGHLDKLRQLVTYTAQG